MRQPPVALLRVLVKGAGQSPASTKIVHGVLSSQFHMADPFITGAIVIVTLNMPREKFWGALLALTPAGASLRGVDLNSIDDFARQVRAGEQVSANLVFFPMHRIERIEIDARNGEIPSLSERFVLKAGRAFAEVAE